jgi:hypothetical protein
MSQDDLEDRPTGEASGRLAGANADIRHAAGPREGPSAARASPGRPARKCGPLCRTLALAALLGLPALPALAQMAPGDAVVTGFSGARPLEPPGTSPDPLDNLFIDTGGNAARVLRLAPSGPPQAQLIPTAPVLEVKAGEVGQVFAITLAPAAGAGPQTPPDIYLGATAAFGLQIVKPGPDGRPQRLRSGDPAAQWMDGQFGTALGGGPGAIYKVDTTTGAATLFATLDNSGPGLGDVVYDPASRQFFASNLDTGLIHRLDANGTAIDTFDHGLAGRPVQGLPPVADDGVAMDIRSPAFKVEDPATWGFAPAARMVYGMAVSGGRLYYAVAEGAQVWSVGIRAADGAFAGDPRPELDVPNVPPGALITDLAFDGQGRLYVALRGAPRGSYDYVAFAEKSDTDVRRFRREVPNGPATPGSWVPVPDDYAIGLPEPFRNAAGGVAIGYDHDAAGVIRRGACGGFVWASGDNLRNNPAYAAQLSPGGAAEVHGLQGNSVSQVRPQNQPPLASYFADYDGTFGDAEQIGHVGDVEIWQPCQTTTGQPAQPVLPVQPVQSGTFGVIEQPVVEGGIPLISCPPGFSFVGGGCAPPPLVCDPGWTPAPPPIFCCPPGHPWTGKSCGHPHPCPLGWTKAPPPAFCCPPGKPWTGKSCGFIPHPCPPGWTKAPPPAVCCPPGKPWTGKSCGFIPCPPGWLGVPPNCHKPIVLKPCPPGTVGLFPNCKPIAVKCPPGWLGTPPNCHKPIVLKPCPPGTMGQFPNCKPIAIKCPPGWLGTPPNCHKPIVLKPCPPGTVGQFPNCKPIALKCPPGSVGKPPNCHKPIVLKPCPPGWTGTPPHCHKPMIHGPKPVGGHPKFVGNGPRPVPHGPAASGKRVTPHGPPPRPNQGPRWQQFH